MPPFIPTKIDQPKPQKESLFDSADKPNISKKTLQDNKNFLESLEDLDRENSLSDVSSEEFEDILLPSPKRRKVDRTEGEGEEDEVDWEDAIENHGAPSNGVPKDLDLTLEYDNNTLSFADLQDRKKGPSKIERQIRISTHRIHVQFLLFHNSLRSRWTCDSKVQKILLDQLPEQIWNEIDKWRKDSGFVGNKTMSIAKKPNIKGKRDLNKSQEQRNQRDWGKPAEKQEEGKPNMSAGDPIIRLLKNLSAYWRKCFTITAFGLRKQGYRTLPMLEAHIASFKRKSHDSTIHGERIDGIEGFREAARMSEGSRDVGAQLFTALLRGLGIEARLVASLQPIGFGWSKNEDALVKKEKNFASSKRTDDSHLSSPSSDPENGNDDLQNQSSHLTSKSFRRVEHPGPKLLGAKETPIELLDDIDATLAIEDDDDESVMDVTPKISHKKHNVQYDRDLPAPNYWTEIVSPITCQIYPVDCFVSKIPVITSSEYFPHFEPRGIKADKAKQVFAYVIAYSSDGTAKDVTTRYLKRHLWPGRTKGVRMPTEKVPIYNRNGKIKKHEEYDWFKTVMSGYERPHSKRTAVDDLEDERDLKRAKVEKKEANVREDTLQFYKTSAEFALERHLRREEAIKPGSKPVRIFISGKGDLAKEEPVFRRLDIEVCRSGESWHKEGRAIKPGEQPLKMVPIRAVTLTRKREVEEAERDSGEKQKQGLYAWNQTDWIIPPPIENGRIPKNAYGNIDCFVPTMVPKGAVHVPLRKTVTICKKLGIDYAEAVTGFEFGNKMAVPVIEGVVVAEHHEHLVIDQWERDERERKIKEEGKRERMALGTWRKWLMGLRIIQRVKEEYGGDPDDHMKESLNPFTNQSRSKGQRSQVDAQQKQLAAQTTAVDDEGMGGGFIVEERDDEGLEFSIKDSKETSRHSRTLMIEGMEEPAYASCPRLEVAATDATSEKLDEQSQTSENTSNEDESDETPPPPTPEPAKSGVSLKKETVKRHSVQKPTPKASQKRKPRLSSPYPSDRQPVRSVPQRHAARKSETAVKSHYFDQESDEDVDEASGQGEDSGSENITGHSSWTKRMRITRSSDNTGRAKKNRK